MTTQTTPARDDAEPAFDISSALEAFTSAVDEAVTTASDIETGTGLALNTDTAAETKMRLAKDYGQVVKARTAAVEAQAAAKAVMERAVNEANAILRAKMAELEPMLKMAKRLEDGIGAVNLYLGRDEYIETLRDGEAAPANVPLTIRQLVLAMDEESALNAAEGGIDFRNIDAFTEWLLEDPAHLDQVIPERRAVVAMMPRRASKQYEDPWTAMSAAEADKESWWLIRNGDQVYLHTTDFQVGRRLVPGRDEFTGMFAGRTRHGEYEPLKPGTKAWLDAEERADARTRHYMKIALILQGLVDRTTVFHPLPVAGLNLLTPDHYEEGFAQIIADDEDHFAIGTGKVSFRDWHRAGMARLTIGQRVIGRFERYSDQESNVTPEGASAPETLVPHTIETEDSQSFSFLFTRTDTIWVRTRYGYMEEHTPKTRARYRIQKGAGDTVIPIDAVTIEEMQYYLTSRSERHAYVQMFPALTAAIAFKQQEELDERPFRQLIAGNLASAHLVDPDGADSYAGELISWWKTKNLWHRALNGDGDHERKAAKSILAEAGRRAKGSSRDADVAATILREHPTAVAIVRRSSDYLAVIPQPRTFSAEAVATNVFVTLIDFTAAGKQKTVREWKTLTNAQVAGWTYLHKTDAWDSWKVGVKRDRHLTDTQLRDGVDKTLAKLRAKGQEPILVRYYEGGLDKRPTGLQVYFASTWDRQDLNQEECDVTLTIVDDETVTVRVWQTHSHAWREDGFGRGSRRAQSPQETRYWGDAPKEAVVWSDHEALAKETEAGDAWYVGYIRRGRIRDRGQQLYMSMVHLWEAANEAREHTRFLEDFGDESLWEGHRKKLTLHYPYRNSKVPGTYWDNSLRSLGHAMAKADHDPAGSSIGELLDQFPVTQEAPLTEELLSLRFPVKEPGTDLVRA